MIDALLGHRATADAFRILEQLHLACGDYAALTQHRPLNVDGHAAERIVEIPLKKPWGAGSEGLLSRSRSADICYEFCGPFHPKCQADS